MVHAHGCGAGDGMTAYVAGSVPHSHQPGPLAMAAQVLSGSASWRQVTDVAAAAVVVPVGVGMGKERAGSIAVSGAPVVGTTQEDVSRGSKLLPASAAPTKIARDAKKKVSVSFVMLKLWGLCWKVIKFLKYMGRALLMIEYACALSRNGG